MPIETALLAERSQDGEARAASSERRAWMPEASVRRDGMGHPDPRSGSHHINQLVTIRLITIRRPCPPAYSAAQSDTAR
jgi:hypothetical protein